MCLICIELAKAKMTSKEARQAFREMREGMDRTHVAEVESKITDLEATESKKS